jgi:hypothetical protein
MRLTSDQVTAARENHAAHVEDTMLTVNLATPRQ